MEDGVSDLEAEMIERDIQERYRRLMIVSEQLIGELGSLQPGRIIYLPHIPQVEFLS